MCSSECTHPATCFSCTANVCPALWHLQATSQASRRRVCVACACRVRASVHHLKQVPGKDCDSRLPDKICCGVVRVIVAPTATRRTCFSRSRRCASTGCVCVRFTLTCDSHRYSTRRHSPSASYTREASPSRAWSWASCSAIHLVRDVRLRAARVAASLVAAAARHRAELCDTINRHLRQWLHATNASVFRAVRHLKEATGDPAAAAEAAGPHLVAAGQPQGRLPLDIILPPPRQGQQGAAEELRVCGG